MESQPNEIITYILSYLDNRTLVLARRTNHKWKNLIEVILHQPNIPPLHMCILTSNHYHFGKHYINYKYDTSQTRIQDHYVYDKVYYANLANIVNDKFIMKQFPKIKKRLTDNEMLIYGAAKCHLDIVKYFVNKGTNISYPEEALIYSAENGHLDVVKYLISKGANLHANDDAAFRCCVSNGYLDMAKYLIDCGVDINSDNFVAYWLKVYHYYMYEYLIGKIDNKADRFNPSFQGKLNASKKMFFFNCST